ncbi:MAG: hypothetical protein DMF31_10940 [Verrucomicrobia bacterium]|nr:MAG: hypothetical protein DMF31_10940 [Verrucomicrobiota bacterium]
MALASAALLAAHLAFIAAASCARRSGERFSFLLAFLALLRFFAPVDGESLLIGRCAVARAADFLAAFIAFVGFRRLPFLFQLGQFLRALSQTFFELLDLFL